MIPEGNHEGTGEGEILRRGEIQVYKEDICFNFEVENPGF
jgi:hypothetical protein